MNVWRSSGLFDYLSFLRNGVLLTVAILGPLCLAQNVTDDGPDGPDNPDPPETILPPDIQNFDVDDYSREFGDVWVNFDIIAPGENAYMRLSNGDWTWSQDLSESVTLASSGNPLPNIYVGTLAAGTYLFQMYVENEEGSIIVEDEFEVAIEDQPLHHNYVRTATPKARVWTDARNWDPDEDGNIPGPFEIELGHWSEAISFADRMGRAAQSVQIKASPDVGSGTSDVVVVAEYDDLGRETRKRLPYVSEGSLPGAYNLNAIDVQEAYYEEPPSNVEAIDYPYGEVEFESSPLQVPMRTISSGNDDNRGELRTTFRLNSVDDGVWRWTSNYIDDPEDVGIWWGNASNGGPWHEANSLYVTSTTDENGRISEDFRNVVGHTILKRVFMGTDENGEPTNTNPFDTYYIYDDQGLLRLVLPPAGVAYLQSLDTDGDGLPNDSQGGVLGIWEAKHYTTRYWYDYAGREIMKKIPEEHAVTTIYDRLGRVVAKQDGLLRAENSWLFTKYDAQGRAIMTGIYRNDELVPNPSQDEWSMDPSIFRRLMQDYVLNEQKFERFKDYETFQNRSSEANPPPFSYTNESFPRLTFGHEDGVDHPNHELLTVTYYDDYDFPHAPEEQRAGSGGGHDFHRNVFDEEEPYWDTEVQGQVLPPFRTWRTLGMATRTEVRVLKASRTYIPSPNYATVLMQDRQLSFITDIKLWTEGLEAAAWIDGSVGVTTTEVEHWQDEMNANVDVTQLDNLEEDSFNTLQTWLDQLHAVSVNNNGTAYLDGPTLQNYNTSLDNMEGIVRQATMQREADDIGAFADSLLAEDVAFFAEMNADSLDAELRLTTPVQNDPEASASGTIRDWITTTQYYDKYGRSIQTIRDGHLEGIRDIASTRYTFDGRVSDTHHYQESLSLDPQTATEISFTKVTLHERFTYDHAGRPLRHYRRVNDEPEVLAAETVYNELGQVIEERLHSNDDGTTFAQTIDYTYHPRGWVKSKDSDLFAMEFYYEDAASIPGGTAFYDGSIGALDWTSPNEGEVANTVAQRRRAYGYEYDNLGRLTAGTFSAFTAAGTKVDEDLYTTTGISYDRNGNLLTLQRYGNVNGQKELIDDLTYHYAHEHKYAWQHGASGSVAIPSEHNSNNLLIAVEDAVAGTIGAYGFENGSNYDELYDPGEGGSPDEDTEIAEYWYNQNGGTVRDRNKGLCWGAYAVNSLPRYMTFTDPTTGECGGRSVNWTYAATGERLRREVISGGASQETTDYLGAHVYRNGKLDFVSTAQGRLVPFRFKVIGTPKPVIMLNPDIFTPISAVGRIASAEADTVAVLEKEPLTVGVNKFMRMWSHEYVLRDHLGGMRVRFRAGGQTANPTATVYQYASYYPYGMEHGGQSYSRGTRDDELFHGKRLDEGHGLDWHHFGWRYYDAEIGRWTAVDPADQFNNAYNYVGGDPVNLVDPDGAFTPDCRNGVCSSETGENEKLGNGDDQYTGAIKFVFHLGRAFKSLIGWDGTPAAYIPADQVDNLRRAGADALALDQVREYGAHSIIVPAAHFKLLGVPKTPRNTFIHSARSTWRGQPIYLRVVPRHRVVNHVSRNFSSSYIRVGDQTILMDRESMIHILERHHPKYWGGEVRETQTFFDHTLDIWDIENIARQVLRQNEEGVVRLMNNTTWVRRMEEFEGVVDGVRYQIGLKNGRIGQFFPLLD